jgi:hypothetical protein
MTFTAGAVYAIHHLRVSLDLPKHFLFLEIQDTHLSFKISKRKAGVRGRRGSECASLDAFVILDCRNYLQLSFG